MPDAGELALESFTGRIGERFEIHPPDGPPLVTRLTEATRLGEPLFRGGREPFSLLFRHPDTNRILPQGTYRMENEVLGVLELFIIPRQPDAEGARYEALFN